MSAGLRQWDTCQSANTLGPNVVHLNWGSQLNPSDCPDDQNYRYLEVNVTGQVSNDADMAPGGYYWAGTEYNRHIQVWKVGVGPAGDGRAILRPRQIPGRVDDDRRPESRRLGDDTSRH